MPGWTTSYTALVTDLQTWFEDDSSEFQGELPEILNRSELRCVRDLDLNVFNTRTSANLTGSSATQTKPGSGAALIVDSLFLTASRKWITRRSLDFVTAYDNGTEALPRYFAATDAASTTIRLAPVPDSAYAVIWNTYDRPDKLVLTSNETNWLTNEVPDLLWQACLTEAALFLGDQEGVAKFNAAYDILRAQAVWEFRHVSRRDAKALEAAARVAKS